MGKSLQSQKSLVCFFAGCEASFTKSWKLEAHFYKHTGLRPFCCENCDRSFYTRYQLTRHQLSHSGGKPHQCQAGDGCSQAFARLRNHTARVHQHQEKPYQCDVQACGKDFSKKNQLKAHWSEQHQQPLSFDCTFNGCKMKFPSPRKLTHHEKVHKGYPCETEECPFKGKTWTEYVNHRKEHLVKVPCGECNKLFTTTWFMHQHELRRHSAKPRRTFGCDKTFTRCSNLQSHVLGDHEGTKPFSCALAGCGMSFAMKESLWRHGMVHDPARKKLKAPHPKKLRPRRSAVQQVPPAAAANQDDTDELVGKLDHLAV